MAPYFKKSRSDSQLLRPRQTGTLIVFDFVKNFGLIVDKNHETYNVNRRSFAYMPDSDRIRQYIFAGKQVSFDTTKTGNGYTAINVRESDEFLLRRPPPPTVDSHDAQEFGTIAGNQNLRLNTDNNNTNNSQQQHVKSSSGAELCRRWTEGSRCFNRLQRECWPKDLKKTAFYWKSLDSIADGSSDFERSKIHKWMNTSATTTEQQTNYDRNDYERELREIFRRKCDETDVTFHDSSSMNKLIDLSVDYLEVQDQFKFAPNRK